MRGKTFSRKSFLGEEVGSRKRRYGEKVGWFVSYISMKKRPREGTEGARKEEKKRGNIKK